MIAFFQRASATFEEVAECSYGIPFHQLVHLVFHPLLYLCALKYCPQPVLANPSSRGMKRLCAELPQLALGPCSSLPPAGWTKLPPRPGVEPSPAMPDTAIMGLEQLDGPTRGVGPSMHPDRAILKRSRDDDVGESWEVDDLLEEAPKAKISKRTGANMSELVGSRWGKPRDEAHTSASNELDNPSWRTQAAHVGLRIKSASYLRDTGDSVHRSADLPPLLSETNLNCKGRGDRKAPPACEMERKASSRCSEPMTAIATGADDDVYMQDVVGDSKLHLGSCSGVELLPCEWAEFQNQLIMY